MAIGPSAATTSAHISTPTRVMRVVQPRPSRGLMRATQPEKTASQEREYSPLPLTRGIRRNRFNDVAPLANPPFHCFGR